MSSSLGAKINSLFEMFLSLSQTLSHNIGLRGLTPSITCRYLIGYMMTMSFHQNQHHENVLSHNDNIHNIVRLKYNWVKPFKTPTFTRSSLILVIRTFICVCACTCEKAFHINTLDNTCSYLTSNKLFMHNKLSRCIWE